MNRAITVNHEYSSEGRKISEKLAQRLGIPLHDKELIAMIAEEGNIETPVLKANDEVDPDLDNYSPRQVPPDYQIAMTQRIYAAQTTVIRSLNDEGPCVTTGRCTGTILPDAVDTFVFADVEGCISRIVSLNPGLAREGAKTSILAVDKGRKAYDEYCSTAQWGDTNAYGVCLSGELTGVEGYLEAALTYIKYVR